jgi:hypothetical protein
MSLWLIVALAVLVVLGLYVVYAFNSLVRVRKKPDRLAIDVQLRRRTD